jgi:chromosome segregation ATPase
LFVQNAKKAEIDNARPSKDSPANDRFKALVADQKVIREQQSANKSSRTSQQEKHNAAENQIKQMIQDQKNQRGKMPFKNVEEIDAQIDHLNKQVDSGKMKLVDEKKALDEVSKLRKQRKGFSALEDMQKRIDEKRAETAELKKTFDTQESRALSQRYEDNQKELDEIKAARDGTNKNFDAIKAEREKLNNEQKATWAKIKDIKDTYYQNGLQGV